MEYRSAAYNVVLTLHLLCAIVGFGSVFLNGIYGTRAKAAGGAVGLAISEAVEAVAKIAEFFIYGVFLFGLGLVFMSGDAIEWSEPWLNISMLLYIVALGISHGVLQPSSKKMVKLQRELVDGEGPAAAGGPPPQVAELEQLGKRVALSSTVLNLMMIVILTLMVFKPGSTGAIGTA